MSSRIPVCFLSNNAQLVYDHLRDNGPMNIDDVAAFLRSSGMGVDAYGSAAHLGAITENCVNELYGSGYARRWEDGAYDAITY